MDKLETCPPHVIWSLTVNLILSHFFFILLYLNVCLFVCLNAVCFSHNFYWKGESWLEEEKSMTNMLPSSLWLDSDYWANRYHIFCSSVANWIHAIFSLLITEVLKIPFINANVQNLSCFTPHSFWLGQIASLFILAISLCCKQVNKCRKEAEEVV